MFVPRRFLFPETLDALNNGRLIRAAPDEEIFQVVYQISPLKTLGPDGMYVIFYQQCWNMLNRNVCGMIRCVPKNWSSSS